MVKQMVEFGAGPMVEQGVSARVGGWDTAMSIGWGIENRRGRDLRGRGGLSSQQPT